MGHEVTTHVNLLEISQSSSFKILCLTPCFGLKLLGGTSMSLKETVESVDDENKSITFKVVDGEIMNHFKCFKSNLQVKAKDEGSLVKWGLEYEKVNKDVPNPDAYLEFAVNVTKDIESHYLKA